MGSKHDARYSCVLLTVLPHFGHVVWCPNVDWKPPPRTGPSYKLPKRRHSFICTPPLADCSTFMSRRPSDVITLPARACVCALVFSFSYRAGGLCVYVRMALVDVQGTPPFSAYTLLVLVKISFQPQLGPTRNVTSQTVPRMLCTLRASVHTAVAYLGLVTPTHMHE